MDPILMTLDEAKITLVDRDVKDGDSPVNSPVTSNRNSNRNSNQTPWDKSLETQSGEMSSLMNIQSFFQSSQKVVFDICKNNEHVAQLILLRGSFKLGESVIGILNFEKSSIPCFQISVYLETTETFESPFASRPKSQVSKLTRKIHSEYHKCTLNTKKTHILLSIPMSACPDFQTSACNSLTSFCNLLTKYLVVLQWAIRFEFVTGNAMDLYKQSVNGDGNFIHYRGLSSIPVDSFNCIVPLKVYGIRTGVKSGKTCRYEVL